MNFDKIFEISMPRTGSRSMACAAVSLGIRTCHNTNYHFCMTGNWLRCAYRGEYDKSLVIRRYEWIGQLGAAIWQNLFSVFPDAGFVLGIRQPDEWLDAIERHRLKTNSSAITHTVCHGPMSLKAFNRLGQFGMLHWNRDIYLQRYLSHNRNIIDMIPSDRLCVMNIFDGDGWPKLCDFIGCSIPNASFPRIKSGGIRQLRSQVGELALRKLDDKWLKKYATTMCGPKQ